MRHGAAIVDVGTSWDRLTTLEQERFMASGVEALSYRVASGIEGAIKLFTQWQAYGASHGIVYDFLIHDWMGERTWDRDAQRSRYTPAAARDEARAHLKMVERINIALAKSANEIGIPVCGEMRRIRAVQGNAEKAVWRGRLVNGRRHQHTQAVESLHAYLDEFAEGALAVGDPDTEYLGFYAPERFYAGGGIPRELRERWRVVCPMVYSDDPVSQLASAMGHWPEHNRFSPYLPVGRWDGNAAVGDEDASLSVARSLGASDVAWWYFGNGSEGAFVSGSHEHRSIAALLETSTVDDGRMIA